VRTGSRRRTQGIPGRLQHHLALRSRESIFLALASFATAGPSDGIFIRRLIRWRRLSYSWDCWIWRPVNPPARWTRSWAYSDCSTGDPSIRSCPPILGAEISSKTWLMKWWKQRPIHFHH
jgi:hypothetical protein